VAGIHTILAVVDPSAAAQPCVGKAARLAQAFGARLDLFICDTSPQLRADRFYAAEFCEVAADRARAEHYAQLETIAAPVREQGASVTTDIVFRNSLHIGIVEKVRALRPDLVVKDTHYHGPIRRTFFTNTDWHLIRECPAPLLLTKPVVWRSVVKLAAAVDPGHADDKPATLDNELLLLTERLALALGGDARAVHVFDTSPILASAAAIARTYGGGKTIDGSLLESVRLAHQHDLDAVIAQHPNFAGSVDLIDGAPAEALPEYAIENAIDVMVMGAIARGALQALLVGRTAERVLDRMPCDILIWKPSRLMAAMQSAAFAA
jgi:universal stress protein E